MNTTLTLQEKIGISIYDLAKSIIEIDRNVWVTYITVKFTKDTNNILTEIVDDLSSFDMQVSTIDLPFPIATFTFKNKDYTDELLKLYDHINADQEQKNRGVRQENNTPTYKITSGNSYDTMPIENLIFITNPIEGMEYIVYARKKK